MKGIGILCKARECRLVSCLWEGEGARRSSAFKLVNNARVIFGDVVWGRRGGGGGWASESNEKNMYRCVSSTGNSA